MYLIPLHQLKSVSIDSAIEIQKIAASGGHDKIHEGPGGLSQVYEVYQNMKTLGFFRLTAAAQDNCECTGGASQRVNDLFEANTVDGHIFFLVEATREAVTAFLDDGLILYKIRGWLTTCFRTACEMPAAAAEDPVAWWDSIFSARGSPLPKNVRVLPFYNKELAPGVPGVILVLVYRKP